MTDRVLTASDPGQIAGAAGQAVRLLSAGEVVALPTETVYGLAADARSPSAVLKIFEAKERPLFDPLIVHLPSREWLERLAVPPAGLRSLIGTLTGRFWPGPLTLLLPRRGDIVPDLVTAGSDLVALRLSAHPVFAAVIQRFGGPLAAPSANRFGRISPTTGAHVLTELDGRIPLVVDAGPTAHGLESTIVEPFIAGGEPRLRLLRHGPVTVEMLEAFAPVVLRAAPSSVAAPGQLPGHYAPRTRLVLATDPMELPKNCRAGLLAWRRDRPPAQNLFAQTEFLSEDGGLRESAAHFFAALRRLDEAGLDLIIAEPVPATGLGAAIMERVGRAAAGSGIANPDISH